jgi:hypothetical protein
MTLGKNEATGIAIAALAHIAEDRAQVERFAALTGIDPANMRQASQDAGFLVAVLDYLAGHEPDLVAFAQSQGLDPALVMAAREVLERSPR